LSDEPEISGEVDLAARALEAMISAHLRLEGVDACLPPLVLGGVKEMSEVTSSQSAAAAAHDRRPDRSPAALPRPRITGPSDGT